MSREPWFQAQPIPGPDPGACPSCGRWRKAGLPHNCNTAVASPTVARPDAVSGPAADARLWGEWEWSA